MRISRTVIASVVVLGAMVAVGFAAGAVEDPEVAPPVVETTDLPNPGITLDTGPSDTEQSDTEQSGGPRS